MPSANPSPAPSKTASSNTDETLYIIDGHAQIFRAFYAIRGGLNSPVTGEPTQATFGVAGVLIKLLAAFKPHYVIMALDSPGKTFRDDIFDQYKANRAAPPTELVAQIPRVIELTKLFGIPIFAQPGAEADDIIATIVRRLTADPQYAGLKIRVVSRDKDLEQLLGPNVTMFDIQTMTTIDTDWLMANKGIRPEQAVDMQTLVGDSVDNVPGVPGIGPKTASTLIQQYGSIEGILQHIDELKGKTRENLLASKEQLALSRSLVRLKADLDLDFSLEKARAGTLDAAGLHQLFRDLGFNKHTRDLDALLGSMGFSNTPAAVTTDKPASSRKPRGNDDGFAPSLFEPDPVEEAAPSEPAPESIPPGVTIASAFDYKSITTQEQLAELVETLRKQTLIALDTETIGLGHRAKVCGISLAWKPGAGVYIPVLSPSPDMHLTLDTVLDALRPIFDNPAIGKTGHNLKYDLLVLRNARPAGARVRGVVFDSLIASHLLGMPTHKLDDLALTQLQHKMIPITDLIGLASAASRGKSASTQKTMDQVPVDRITIYAAEDADMALRLQMHFTESLTSQGMADLADKIEMPLVEVLAEMEFHGIRVDPIELKRQQDTLSGRITDLRRAVQDAAQSDFNPDSPKQLADVLFNRLGLPVKKKTKTGPSTDIEVLEALAESDDLPKEKLVVPKLIVEYRQLTKLVNTYLESLREAISPETGRVHATFQQALTVTGRLSSNNPNLQNIPIRTEVGRQVRRAFIADPGNHLISADYSQIELRILAHLSGDANLIEQFEKDLDIHTAVASQVFATPLDQVSREQRARAKVINFGIVYGVTPYGLARRIENLDAEGAKKLIADYKQRFRGIDDFLQSCIRQALNMGYVTTMNGRRRLIPEITSSNGATRALGERLAINTVVQGSAAELIKIAMVSLHRRIDRERLPMRMLLQIHDELVFETPAGEAAAMSALIREEMESAMKLRVPLKVDAASGPTWFDTK